MEMAICLPVLILLVMATIEASNMIFLRQALAHAGYEGARVASRPTASNSEPGARANAILAARNIDGATVVVSPSDIESLSRGSQIVVTVTAPTDANSLMPYSHFGSQTLSVSMTAVKTGEATSGGGS